MSINYSRAGDIIKITIESSDRAKIETLTANIKDKKKCASILNYLKDKYDWSPEISQEESINAKNEEIDWWK
jgi:uncharacterized membrane protein YvbJ